MEKILRRRASVPKDFGTATHELDPIERRNIEVPSVAIDRREVHRIVMDSPDKRRVLAIRILRVFNILIGPILIGLSASLLGQYRTLRDSCNGDFDSGDCDIYRRAVGAFKYCIFPGIWSILQGGVGLWATYSQTKLLNPIITMDSMAAGFHMGAGCTLAALLNGWSCRAGADAGQRLCDQYYTAVAFFFAGVVSSYGIIALWCQCKCFRKVRRGGMESEG